MERFIYTAKEPQSRRVLLPRLPFTLISQKQSLNVYGLLDTGSSVNVLPYSLGIQFGGTWEDELPTLHLTGNLAKSDAQPFVLNALIGSFAEIELVFAWTKADNIPIILGQYDFFEQFDACFFRSEMAFELQLKK